jgi:hydrogenase 3 maturation protease
MHKLYLYYTVETSFMEYLVMCVGNREGGDDAVGPYIADKLKSLKNDAFFVLDCGVVPENYTSIVKQHKPRNLIIVDAVEMRLKPGEMRVVPKEKIGSMHISTHGIPISILISYLKEFIENIIFIGIQPERMSDKITESVRKSADKIVELIKEKKIDEIKTL